MLTDGKSLLLLRIFFLSAVMARLVTPAMAADDLDTETPKVIIEADGALVTGFIPMHLPAFHDADLAGVSWDDLLQEMPAIPGSAWPRDGDNFPGVGKQAITWAWQQGVNAQMQLGTPQESGVHYLAFYINSDRWQECTLSVTGNRPLLGVMGSQQLSFTKEDGQEDQPATRTADLKLPIGKHLIVLRTLHNEEFSRAWDLGISLTTDTEDHGLTLGGEPDHAANIETVLNAPKISQVSLSPDGRLTAISLSEYRNGSDRERWLEVRDTKSGKLMRLWRGDHAPSGIDWHPEGHVVTWQTSSGETATIRTYDFASGETAVVLADVEDLGGWQWAPDGKSIVYAITRTPDADPRKVKHVLHPADRQSWWRGRSHLMQVFVPTGVTRRLTAGPVSPSGWEISPDGSRMVFFTSEPDMSKRPYSTSEMWLLDMQTLAVEQILTDPWVSGAHWSPDGRFLLLDGSASAFDGMGRNLPKDMVANDYGGQLYIYDPAEATAEAISLNLRPDVSWSAWSPADGMIYARTIDTQYNTIYRFKPGSEKWEKVATDLDIASQVTLAKDARTAVVRGESVTSPNTVRVIDLKKNRSSLLLDPGTAWYRDVVFGKIENWTAELDKGMKMDGFIYYPPGFDPAQKYPVIVYYYGGTSPITRTFGGRYPKNIWAGQDYIVYAPNPSGATGYGQEFAARHVNDWGRLTAPEVIEGTRKFLAAHPYADADKVGCMGASYGGFLTEYIITQTDLFAAAISHAGISDISSYWGEGMWGYAYGARALANSFPWADRELYVEQSPLFHADKITTPLLLVHGDSDINVPKGESDQLFVAMKMLGKEVDYVQIVGQDHHIVDHEQRIVWHNTIMAYLAKHLKDRPQWWDEMYPAPKDYR